MQGQTKLEAFSNYIIDKQMKDNYLPFSPHGINRGPEEQDVESFQYLRTIEGSILPSAVPIKRAKSLDNFETIVA